MREREVNSSLWEREKKINFGELFLLTLKAIRTSQGELLFSGKLVILNIHNVEYS
jgi:hypothetical protein